MKKEIWIVPCNYSGFVKVYFKSLPGNSSSSSEERIYHVNPNGVAMSNLPINDGFTENLNETMTLKMQCNGTSNTILYYDNSVSDTVSADVFATNLIVGKEGNYFFKSLFIVKRNSKK